MPQVIIFVRCIFYDLFLWIDMWIIAGEGDLVDKATELRAKWMSLEGEKYDIEMTFKKQDYDVSTLVVSSP